MDRFEWGVVGVITLFIAVIFIAANLSINERQKLEPSCDAAGGVIITYDGYKGGRYVCMKEIITQK